MALPARVWAQTLPPRTTPGSTVGNETIRGVIESVLGPYRILVRDNRGFVDDVTLRPGTVINPRGLRLAVGMSVTIGGFAAGSTFTAVEIDAPSEYGAPSGSPYYDYSSPGYYFDYEPNLVESPAGPAPVVKPVVVQPPPGARRGFEPPLRSTPSSRPLEDAQTPPALPSYAVPPTAYHIPSMPTGTWPAPGGASNGGRNAPVRGQAGSPQYGAPAPDYRAPSAPEYRAAAPSAPRYDPGPARSDPAPARSDPAPARSDPAPSRESSSNTKPH